MAKGIIKRMTRALFKREPKTPRDMKYYLKYGPERWHSKAYPHKYTRNTGPK